MADPILAAIANHKAAYDAFQVAPDGEDSVFAQDEMLEAREAMLSASCATLSGCFALVEHLRWFLAEEAENYAVDDGPEWRRIKAREAELTMLLGSKLAAPTATPLAHQGASYGRWRPGNDVRRDHTGAERLRGDGQAPSCPCAKGDVA